MPNWNQIPTHTLLSLLDDLDTARRGAVAECPGGLEALDRVLQLRPALRAALVAGLPSAEPPIVPSGGALTRTRRVLALQLELLSLRQSLPADAVAARDRLAETFGRIGRQPSRLAALGHARRVAAAWGALAAERAAVAPFAPFLESDFEAFLAATEAGAELAPPRPSRGPGLAAIRRRTITALRLLQQVARLAGPGLEARIFALLG